MSEYGIIDGVNFVESEAEKYWSFAKSYKGDKRAETKAMITGGAYTGAIKKDGHYARFIKDMNGNMRLQGRTKGVAGEYLNKIDWVPQCQPFFDSLPNGTVLLGELYFPNNRGSRKVTTILGCLQSKAIERQEKGEKLTYYVFDVWAYNGKSYLNTKIEDRIKTLNNISAIFSMPPYIEFAKYYSGQELWEIYGNALANNEEGIVITKLGTTPDPGKRPARKTLKCKLEIEQTIDAFIDGDWKKPTKEYSGKEIETWTYWINDKTGEKLSISSHYREYINGESIIPVTKLYYLNYAAAVSFSVMKDGVPIHIGWISGIPDTMREVIVKNPDKIINSVFELSAMEIEHTTNGYSLRHGKIVQRRCDKNYSDCDWSQIEQ